MVDLVDLDDERLDNVVTDEFEVGMANPLRDVALLACEEIINDEYFMAEKHETIDEMGADKTCSTSDEDPFLFFDWQHPRGQVAIR